MSKQPISKTKVLELRQADDPNTTVNGDFQTSFEPFSMVEGDSVVLKSCILDTKDASLTKVVVADDLVLTIDAYPYVINYQYDDKQYFSGIEPDGKPTDSSNQPDHQRYFAMQLVGGPNHRLIESVVITSGGVGSLGPFTFKVYYQDVNGDMKFSDQTYTFPFTKAKRHPGIGRVAQAQVSIQLLAWGGSDFTNPTVPDLDAAGNTYTFAVSPAETNGGTFEAVMLSHDVEVKAGSYDPQSLCTLINDQLNQNSGGNRALEAPFLQESAHYGKRIYTMDIATGSAIVTNVANSKDYPLPVGTEVESTGIAAGTTIATYNHTAKTATLSADATATGTTVDVTATNTIYMINEDNSTGPNGFRFENSTLNSEKYSSLFGSSQMQLDIDVTNQFKWKYLHTPYYDPTTGNQALLFDWAPDVNKMFKMGSTGGVAISGLTAKVKATKASSPFWSSQLGFSGTNCNCQVGSWVKKSTSNFTGAMFPVFANVDLSTTTQFIGSDDAVQKQGKKVTSDDDPPVTSYTDQQFYALSSSSSFRATADADSTLAIVAETAYTELVGNATGYFKIDIAGIAPTELVSSGGTTRSVQAVVNRFYNDGNFTSGSQDSGMVYQHAGQPTMISSLHTRVLDPDNSIAKGLGPDNTVFLEILKV